MNNFERDATASYLMSLISYLDIGRIYRKGEEEPILKEMDEYEYKISRFLSKFKNPEPYEINISIKELFDKSEYTEPDTIPAYNEIKEVLKANPELGDIKLLTSSHCTPGYYRELIDCLVFEDEGHLDFSFRGTGAGKWMDNGQGLYTLSQMQAEAINYFNQVTEVYSDKAHDMLITGHSKGGNLAQTVTMLGNKGGLIKNTFSFDGQGFAPETIKFMENKNAPKRFERLSSNIISICTTEDPVHELGRQIVPKENIYLVFKRGRKFAHELTEIGSPNNPGTINFTKNISGKIVTEEESTVLKIARDFSEKVLTLPITDRKDICLAVMGFAQGISQGELGLIAEHDEKGKRRGLIKFLGYKDQKAKTVHQGSGTIKAASKKNYKTFNKKGLDILFNSICDVCIKENTSINALISSIVPISNPFSSLAANVLEECVDLKKEYRDINTSHAYSTLKRALIPTLEKAAMLLKKSTQEYSQYSTTETIARFNSFVRDNQDIAKKINELQIPDEEKTKLYLDEFLKEIKVSISLHNKNNEKDIDMEL